MNALDAALLEAHNQNDITALIELYAQAADEAETSADIDAACFFLTHAYVFALEAGSDLAKTLHTRLKSYGREE